MFEKRKLDRVRFDALEVIAGRSDGVTTGQFPCMFGLAERQVAGSLVTVGAFLLDGVISSPPVPEPGRRAEEKLIIRNLSVDGVVQGSVCLAHAVIRWCIVRDHYEEQTGRSEDATLLGPREAQMLDLLQRSFPLSEESAAQLDQAAASYRDFDLTPETIGKREPVKSSGWMNYLRDPDFADPEEGKTREERLSDLVDSHFLVAGNYYRAVASRHAIALAVGSAYDETKSSEFPLEDDMSYEALKGEMLLAGAWTAIGADAYYTLLADIASEAVANEAEGAQWLPILSGSHL